MGWVSLPKQPKLYKTSWDLLITGHGTTFPLISLNSGNFLFEFVIMKMISNINSDDQQSFNQTTDPFLNSTVNSQPQSCSQQQNMKVKFTTLFFVVVNANCTFLEKQHLCPYMQVVTLTLAAPDVDRQLKSPITQTALGQTGTNAPMMLCGQKQTPESKTETEARCMCFLAEGGRISVSLNTFP